MSLAPHQQRVVEEKRELDEKIAKLTAFLNSAAITQVSLAEARRMSRQHGHMLGYSVMLGQRIAAFEEV